MKQHQPALVAGDENAAVAVDLQPVRPAVILTDLFPLALGRDAEDPAEGDVGDIEPTGAFERGAFEKESTSCPPRLALAQAVGRGLRNLSGKRVKTVVGWLGGGAKNDMGHARDEDARSSGCWWTAGPGEARFCRRPRHW
jgi:hypothetical protein